MKQVRLGHEILKKLLLLLQGFLRVRNHGLALDPDLPADLGLAYFNVCDGAFQRPSPFRCST